MRFAGTWQEVEDLEEDAFEISEAIVTKSRIAIDWEEGGDPRHAMLHSDDGYFYRGTFGFPQLDSENKLEAWRYRSVAGDELLWIKWELGESGAAGTAMIHLS